MEGSSLFNPGFLGGNFSWWIGQIPASTTWRENIIPYVHPDVNANKGWGYRYKVRIIGIHDWGEGEIESGDLPWAQVMYPVTSGGNLGGSTSTPGLKQGNIVFGFFMDQGEQQIPVIMGVLGNNAQVKKYYEIGNDRVTNQTPGSLATSAFALKPGETRESQDSEEFKQEPEPPDFEKLIVAGPGGNKTAEGGDVQAINVSDTKRQFDKEIKHVLLSPCDMNGSSIKGIQTALDNLMRYMDQWLGTINSYVDTVSSSIQNIGDMKNILKNIACEIAKYMKIIMDNVMQYVLKLLNKSLTPMVAGLPSTMRSMFGDMKDIITELIVCLYNKMISGMCEMIANLLLDAFDLEGLEQKAKESEMDGTHPEVPICYAEDLVSKVLAANQQEIDDANNSIIEKLDVFVSDIQEEMAGLSDSFSNIQTVMGDLVGGISGALSFNNISMKIFGCDLLPSCSSTDYFSLSDGGSALPDTQQPDFRAVSSVLNLNCNSGQQLIKSSTPFLQPTLEQPDVDNTQFR